jgi:putative phosphoesterase
VAQVSLLLNLRIAIVSDIHGNLTAFDAVLADLRETAPDLIFHGGDLVSGGAHSPEIVDRIRDLGWQGVLGNTDEMMFRPESVAEFLKHESIAAVVQEMAAVEREWLGEERIAWLRGLPLKQVHDSMALVHACPESCWRSPMPEATDLELETAYAPLGKPVAVYGHVHRGFVRTVSSMTVVNTGSVSMPHDGDRRASYLLLDHGKAEIRRVEYGLDRELRALANCGLPHADWVGRILESGRPQMP